MRRQFAAMLALLIGLAACGESGTSGSSAGSDIASVPPSTSEVLPKLGALSVNDGCAQVQVANGEVWADSCLPPSVTRPRAVVSETIDGVELALLRVSPGVEMVAASVPTVRFDQAEGWVLVESPTAEFSMTFRAAGTGDAVCDYNPLFIDCESSGD